MKSHEKIRKIREEKKWSQEELANKLVLSTNGYAKIERGETRLTLSRLFQLAEIFKLDIFELIQGDIQYMGERVASHINHECDLVVYSATEHKNLIQEIEKLKLIIQHQETLLAQQTRELNLAQKILAIYEQNIMD
ncbi:helix-turn-helix transcriptional regulator [Simonsiella muelleri]|uniref:helix-turn-helix domain-containing protein n=1 Tax=Simonsiella muelleri TaxID=72 RepID=UPI0028D860D5|nr:helix-turn-helix transcriptional regulator [Simonsiella muelleri]